MSGERAVEARAARQHGAISVSQALDAGMTRKMVRQRREAGRWLRTGYVGVYRMAGHPATWKFRASAAVLAGPPGTVASHLTAAALLGLSSAPARPHVTVPAGTSARKAGAEVHRSHLAAVDRCLLDRIPGTRPARTLVDCAQVLDGPALMAIVDPCLCRQLTTPAKVLDAAGRVTRRTGPSVLKSVLVVWTDGITPGSAAEMRLLRRISRWGFPPPVKQWEVHDAAGVFVARLDLGWPSRRAGLEYDGREHHGPRQWESDEERQARIEALGVRVERVEKVDLLDGADRLRGVLGGLLAAAA